MNEDEDREEHVSEVDTLDADRVLGAAIRYAGTAEKIARAGVTRDDMPTEQHGDIWTAMLAVASGKGVIDAGLVEAHLIRTLKWDRAEARRSLMEVEEAAHGGVNDEALAGYVDGLRRKAGMRRLRELGRELVELATTDTPIAKVGGDALKRLEGIIAGSTTTTSVLDLADLVHAIHVRLVDADAPEHKIRRVPLGVRAIDRATRGGVRLGTVTLFGGESSVGKTTNLRHMALSAMRASYRVGIITTEATHEELATGFVEGSAGVAVEDARTPDDHSKLTTAIAEFHSRRGQCFIDRVEGVTAEEVRAKMFMLKRKGVDVIFLDYVQDVAQSTRYQRDDLNWRHISITLRKAAMAHEQALIEFSQVNEDDRGVKGPQKRKAQDIFAFTKQWYKDAHYAIHARRDITSDDETTRNTTHYMLTKNRPEHGKTERAWMRYDSRTTRLVDCDANGNPHGGEQMPLTEEPAHDPDF